MTHEEIAKNLYDLRKNIVLIYAFNSTGKTRLSVAYKNYSKAQNDGEHAGVYYNAYSEDLFRWDNDEEHDNANVRLEVVPSSLNEYHSFFLDNPELIKEKLESYMPSYDFVLNPHKDRQDGIESVTFFKSEKDKSPYKISRGEERIFVWCFFLALFEVEEFSQKQDRHILIDDPVSSLDESNVLLTAQWIFDLITSEFRKKRFIISTHHIGLFSILGTWINRMDEKNALHDLYILKNNKGDLNLRNTNQEVFLYHLHLLQTLQEARNGTLYKYHIVLLRQVLENVNSFLGSRKIGRLLGHIKVDDPDNKSDTINAYSHKQAFQLQASEMSEHEVTVFKEVFDKLMDHYRFKLP